jgi:hypothetical protein
MRRRRHQPASPGVIPTAVLAARAYTWIVTTSAWTAEEIRAAAETHRELPPEYQSAVIESFLSKVDREIDARVDARIAGYGSGRVHPARPRTPAFFVLASLVFGIPLSAIAVAAGAHPAGFWGLLVVWIGIVLIDITYIGRHQPPRRD